MVDVQTVGVLVTAASVSIAAIYYMFTLRINMRTQELALKTQQQTLEARQADFLLRQTQVIMGTQYQKAWFDVVWQQRFATREEWGKKYGWSVNPEAYNNMISLLLYFNHLGVLLRENMIQERVLTETVTPVIILHYWKRVKPLIEFWRSRYQCETLLEGIEYLAEKTIEYHPEVYKNVDIPYEERSA